MSTIKGNLLWLAALTVWIIILIIPNSRELFVELTEQHPYIGGFVKFAILATMGDLLGARIIKGSWSLPKGIIAKAALWGTLGVMITLIFSVFVAGTSVAQQTGKLPFAGSTVALAFFASTLMNITFGPMLYIYHKFGDLYIDMKYDKERISVKSMVEKVDWEVMVGFSWLITCSVVWIPCHTLVFLLPEHYRVLASAFLSILLGVIVAISKRAKNDKTETSLSDYSMDL